MTTPTADAARALIEELREAAGEQSGRSIDRGCQDCGINANMLDRAADALEALPADRASASARIAAAGAAGEARGIERAARVLDKKAADYHAEHGFYDHETGATEYPGDGGDWMMDWEETAEAIRALPPSGADHLAALVGRARADGAGEWLPIEQASKDGTVIWAILRADLSTLTDREDLRWWDGIQVPLRHPGLCDGGFDLGWSVAAPVGSGGFPDRWIAGWRPLPAPPTRPAAEASGATGEGETAP